MIYPARCTPKNWENLHCRLPSEYPSTIELLRRAGVTIGLGTNEDSSVRGLMFEAAWQYADSNDPSASKIESKMSESEAIGLVTWNVADILGIDKKISAGRIKIGMVPRLVGYKGNPLSLNSCQLIVIDEKVVKFKSN